LEDTNLHNKDKTCWNCPAALLKGNVEFRACGQSVSDIRNKISEEGLLIECARLPELGMFEPSITYDQCPEWRETEYGYLLKDMRIMILGIDGYLGWTLALKLAKLGCKVSGLDNYLRRRAVAEKGSKSVVPIADMATRLKTAKEVHGVDINFREMDLLNRDELSKFLEEAKPEAVIHYGEIPSAPYSMVDAEHAILTQHNNTLGTLGVLFLIKEHCPEASLIKLGTMGEYGTPLTGRPIFEGLFPADAVISWQGQEWSMGGELTPRDPASFYHVSKVQDTFNVYEACKYWWLRSYDIMQGVIFGVHTAEVSAHEDLRTRLDVDEWFGTVINRFVSQAVLGIPLTVYGSGEQIRGYLALEDAMECMTRLIASPPEPGQYDVVNQLSQLYKVKELAEIVAKIGSQNHGLTVQIQRVENPRVEADEHPFLVVSKKLREDHGYDPKTPLEVEIDRMFALLLEPEVRERLESIREAVFPQTWWNGNHKTSMTLEVYEPGTIEIEGYQPTLVTKSESYETETQDYQPGDET
jgi:UDP-sulfoquinovose synthase